MGSFPIVQGNSLPKHFSEDMQLRKAKHELQEYSHAREYMQNMNYWSVAMAENIGKCARCSENRSSLKTVLRLPLASHESTY